MQITQGFFIGKNIEKKEVLNKPKFVLIKEEGSLKDIRKGLIIHDNKFMYPIKEWIYGNQYHIKDKDKEIDDNRLDINRSLKSIKSLSPNILRSEDTNQIYVNSNENFTLQEKDNSDDIVLNSNNDNIEREISMKNKDL